MVMKYIITKTVILPVNMKAVADPNLNQIIPVIELASMVQILCKPAYAPMAEAVSCLGVIFEIHALEIPSVAAE